MKLYDYFRSTASYRVRIALNLKQLSYDLQEVHLVNNGGEQHSATYKNLNPQELVPTLQEDELTLSQSLAILEYLEEKYPKPSILPKGLTTRAKARMLANIVTCDIHPLNNLRVLQYLQKNFEITAEQKTTWYYNWLDAGLTAFEEQLTKLKSDGNFCLGTSITIADICLIPQLYNAHRFNFSLAKFPLISSIEEHCLQLPAFADAAP